MAVPQYNWLHPKQYNECNYSTLMGLKITHVSKNVRYHYHYPVIHEYGNSSRPGDAYMGCFKSKYINFHIVLQIVVFRIVTIVPRPQYVNEFHLKTALTSYGLLMSILVNTPHRMYFILTRLHVCDQQDGVVGAQSWQNGVSLTTAMLCQYYLQNMDATRQI